MGKVSAKRYSGFDGGLRWKSNYYKGYYIDRKYVKMLDDHVKGNGTYEANRP